MILRHTASPRLYTTLSRCNCWVKKLRTQNRAKPFISNIFGIRESNWLSVIDLQTATPGPTPGLTGCTQQRRKRGKVMRYLKYAALLGVLLFAAASAHAQVRIGVGIGVGPAAVGPEPICAYGYYSYYPYACAPYGYWAPSYFVNGIFVGVGPWYHAHWRPVYRGPRYYGRPVYGHPYARPYAPYRAPAHAYVNNGHGGGFHGPHGAPGGFHGGGHGGGHR